ncbi:hypothetical protein [Tolypothrix sp. FACHB-123]|nr:hypothetical protein [Tolypothrix sp. FACHB-123]
MESTPNSSLIVKSLNDQGLRAIAIEIDKNFCLFNEMDIFADVDN